MKIPRSLKFAAKPKPPAPVGGSARAVPTGTSYTALGIAPPPSGVDTEMGSSQPIQVRDIVPQLVSAFQRIQTYAQMMNDAGVDVSMRVAKTPVLGADFFVEPYSTTNPMDVEIAEFISANLFEGMSAPFINSLEDILHLYEDGYSVVEKVYEQREWAPKRQFSNTRNYTMLRKLAFRPASTIKNFEYDDNGGPVKLVQNAIQADQSVKEVDLEIANIIVFTMNRRGGDLTGKSLLRTAYPHWYYKTHFYKLDGIQKERNSLGVPKGKLLPGFTAADKEAMRTLLRNLRNNEEAFMLLTPNVEVEFAELQNQPINVLESASHHNVMIMMNVLAQFLTLGVEGQGGGRATAGAQTDIFMKALKHVASYIADCLNMYLIPELVVWNYPTKNFPKLKVRNIGETRDLQMLGSAIANLYAQGAITPDTETENWVRSVFDMPSTTATPVPKAKTKANGQGNPANVPAPAKGNVSQQSDKVGGNVGKPPNAAA
jgi:Protein of unknown function (DUF935)